MTDYTAHPDALFDPNAPILGSTHLEARDNVTATAEGALGAPKIADKTAFAGDGTTTFTNVGAWGGVWVHAAVRASIDTTRSITISFSDDGTTFYGSTTVVEAFNGTSDSTSTGTFFVDFATGSYKSLYLQTDDTVTALTGTVSGLSSSVTASKDCGNWYRWRNSQIPRRGKCIMKLRTVDLLTNQVTEIDDPNYVAPAPTAQMVKAEASRRILAILPEWKQRNLIAQAAILGEKGRANWTAEELAAWNAGGAIWAQVAAIRAASDTIEAMDPIPANYKDDNMWPAQ